MSRTRTAILLVAALGAVGAPAADRARGAAPAAALAPASAPDAAAGTWRVVADVESTRVTFTLGATLHDVEGVARLAAGGLELDAASGAASGTFVIDATSLDTGNEKRDRDMHRKVLESATYPTITFAAESFSGDLVAEGDFELELAGALEIHDGSHGIVLAVRGHRTGDEVTAETAFAIPYVEWGMNDPSKFVLRVAKTVEVEIALAGSLAAGGTAEEAEEAGGIEAPADP